MKNTLHAPVKRKEPTDFPFIAMNIMLDGTMSSVAQLIVVAPGVREDVWEGISVPSGYHANNWSKKLWKRAPAGTSLMLENE